MGKITVVSYLSCAIDAIDGRSEPSSYPAMLDRSQRQVEVEGDHATRLLVRSLFGADTVLQ